MKHNQRILTLLLFISIILVGCTTKESVELEEKEKNLDLSNEELNEQMSNGDLSMFDLPSNKQKELFKEFFKEFSVEDVNNEDNVHYSHHIQSEKYDPNTDKYVIDATVDLKLAYQSQFTIKSVYIIKIPSSLPENYLDNSEWIDVDVYDFTYYNEENDQVYYMERRNHEKAIRNLEKRRESGTTDEEIEEMTNNMEGLIPLYNIKNLYNDAPVIAYYGIDHKTNHHLSLRGLNSEEDIDLVMDLIFERIAKEFSTLRPYKITENTKSLVFEGNYVFQ